MDTMWWWTARSKNIDAPIHHTQHQYTQAFLIINKSPKQTQTNNVSGLLMVLMVLMVSMAPRKKRHQAVRHTQDLFGDTFTVGDLFTEEKYTSQDLSFKVFRLSPCVSTPSLFSPLCSRCLLTCMSDWTGAEVLKHHVQLCGGRQEPLMPTANKVCWI